MAFRKTMFKVCPNCGHKNPASEFMCQKCMTDLSMVQPTEDIQEDKTIIQSSQKLYLEGEGYRIELSPDQEYILGRAGTGMEYFKDNPYVSRRHAKVYFKDGQWFVEDLNSTNGTYVNGKRIQKAKLEDGCILEFSTYLRLKVVIVQK
ncbi:MAG: FHA domain-containing protein [Aquificaceae bacterium]|nr:FHA domain-containing protein [Aquificaceae bacterium]